LISAPDPEETKPEPPTPSIGTRVPPRPRRRLKIALIATGVVLAAIVGLSVVFADRSPDSSDVAPGRVVFTTRRDGNWEVYAADSDGSNPRNLTRNSAEDEPSAVSRDGRKIAFRTHRDGSWEIYSMNADGSGQRRLTDGQGENFWPTWSPNGAAIAFTRDRDETTGIFVMNADGSNVREVVTTPRGFPEYRVASSPWHSRSSFAPTGESIVFEAIGQAGADIFVMSLRNGETQKLTADPGIDRSAVWSPAGDLIVFTSNRDGNSEIYTMRPDGSRETRITNNSADDAFPSFTTDGKHIVFETERTGDQDIWIMESTGQNPRPLITNPQADHIPEWLRLP
jgi:TolB protein